MKKITRNILVGIFIGVFVLLGAGYFLIPSQEDSSNNSSSGLPSNTSNTGESNLLESACQNAINDYPGWTKPGTDLVIWKTPEEGFYFRNSPEDKVTSVDSPAQNPEVLVDMDFIGENEISYVKTQDNEWKIGLFKLKGLDPPDNSVIYSKEESISNIDSSSINKNEFIVFYEKEGRAFLKYFNTNSEERTLSETSVAAGGKKVAVSPSENYVYLLYGGILRIFEIESGTKINEINSVGSVVWLGNNYLVYSTSSGTFVYGIKEKETQQIAGLSSISDLTFNPKGNGILAYTEDNTAKINDCKTWAILGSKQNGRLHALVSEKTAIMQNAQSFGYWTFKDADVTITFIADDSDIATSWSRY